MPVSPQLTHWCLTSRCETERNAVNLHMYTQCTYDFNGSFWSYLIIPVFCLESILWHPNNISFRRTDKNWKMVEFLNLPAFTWYACGVKEYVHSSALRNTCREHKSIHNLTTKVTEDMVYLDCQCRFSTDLKTVTIEQHLQQLRLIRKKNVCTSPTKLMCPSSRVDLIFNQRFFSKNYKLNYTSKLFCFALWLRILSLNFFHNIPLHN